MIPQMIHTGLYEPMNMFVNTLKLFSALSNLFRKPLTESLHDFQRAKPLKDSLMHMKPKDVDWFETPSFSEFKFRV